MFVEMKNFNFIFKDKKIAGAEVGDCCFADYVRLLSDAFRRCKNDADIKRAAKRAPLLARVRLKTEDGAFLALENDDIGTLPLAVGNFLNSTTTDETETPGEIIVKEQNMAGARVLYRLGAPLNWQENKADELEFLIKSYGDIEDIEAESFVFRQALMLLQTAAMPLFTNISIDAPPPKLLRLPDILVSKISMADGLKIAAEVLPYFLNCGLA